jgi:tRNA dimethylallyltransferase
LAGETFEKHCRSTVSGTWQTVRVIGVLVGPTATGKSALAMALATQLGDRGHPAEIVNVDSMLVYRGMDIGTAKPTAAERARVPHHLIDILDVTETATVASLQGLARAAIADCGARGVLPLVVGGSALYVRAVLDDFTFPGTDPELRRVLAEELAREGAVALHARLASQDPAAARAIEPANGRRIVRALEVLILTGRPYAATLPEHAYVLPEVRQVGLHVDRSVLDARIAGRVEAMWKAGLVAEVQVLVGRGLREGVTASRALGYAQVLQYLDGELSEEEAIQATVSATRRFARRQGSWFRRDHRIAWVDGDAPDLVPTAERLLLADPW